MANAKIEIAESNGRISIRTATGFTLANARFGCEIRSPKKRLVAGTPHIRTLNTRAIQFSHSLTNTTNKPLKISSVITFDGEVQADGKGWQLVHPELFKSERYFDGYSYFTQGLFAPLESATGTFGLSEDFPFPGIIFHHPERGTILISVLSQNHSKPTWTISGSGRKVCLRANDHFHGVGAITVPPGADFASEDWLILFSSDGIDAAIDDYFKLLTRRLPMVGKTSILRKAIVWGSWNYNVRPNGHRDIDHKWIAANARALPKIAPDKPRFIMIDDGYQNGCSNYRRGMSGWLATAFEIFHDDGQPAHDPKLFPKGMKGIADAIRKAGCQPALWLTPRIHRDSQLAKDHPEWLVKMGNPADSSRIGRFLDYSLPEVRDFTCRVWDTVFNQWGFKAIKMDFWSMPFEVPSVRYRNSALTAIQLRNQFLSDLRQHVPADGYVITGCCTNSGNPFLGRHIDSARSSADIGDGTADRLRESATVLTEVTPFYRHDALLSDADSIGWCPGASKNENHLWATMALMSGAICEIAGDLNTLTADARRLLETTIAFFAPAKVTRNTLFSRTTNAVPASHLRLERNDATYEAHLNWTLYPREVHLEKPVTDIWTQTRLKGRTLIPPLSAVFYVSDKRPRR